MSIAQIATLLNLSKATAQSYLSRGTGYIKYFLDKDIKEQDKKDKKGERKIKILKCKRGTMMSPFFLYKMFIPFLYHFASFILVYVS